MSRPPKPPRDYDIPTETQGTLLLCATFPTPEAPWGFLEPLRGTPWAVGVREVSGESFSHALHGYTLPLSRALGRPPRANARHIPFEVGVCTLHEACALYNPKTCVPSKDTLECYEGVNGIVSWVVRAWASGRHTVVVVGSEFNEA
jgi:hypothetical protein